MRPVRWALLLVALVALWCTASVSASRDAELAVADTDADDGFAVDTDADADADADVDVDTDAAPAPAVAGHGKAKAKGKAKAAKAKAKAKKKPFDDFGLARAAAFKLPKRAIRVRGNARTHRLKTGKLMIRSRLPFTDAKAQRSAGVCKAGKCKLKLRAKAKAKAKTKGKGKAKGKGKSQGKAKAKTAAEAFPKSALPPVPFSAEELKAAAKRAAKGHAFVQLSGSAAADADAETDAALAAADEDADSGADASDADADADADVDDEEDADAGADADAEEGDAFVEAAAVSGRNGGKRKGKGKGKAKKHKRKHKKQRVPVLVSRPSALVRRRVKAKRVKTLRGYARHVHAKGARVHVITPHRRTVTKLVTTGKGKNRKQRLVTTVSKRKRKIELTALLEVTGNVLFGKRGDELKERKHKGKGKGKGKGKHNAKVKHAATGTAFIENLLVLSKRNTAAPAAAAADSEDPHAHGHGHTHQHQWRLVYDDVNAGWTAASHAAAPHCSTLRRKWAASPLPAVVPVNAFAGTGAASDAVAPRPSATVQQTLTDLPEHSLIAVSGTFHFLGAWRGEVGFATVNGAHVWLDTFAAAAGDDIDASAPQQNSVPFRVVLPHTAHDVSIGFGSTLPADADDRMACWAFDDVAVSVMH